MSSPQPSIPWIQSTLTAVKLAKGASDAQSEAVRLEDAESRLSALLAELRTIAASSELVSNAIAWPGRSPRPEVFSDLKEASSLQPRPLERLARALDIYVREVTSDLLNTWSAHAASALGNVEELQVLANVLRAVEDVADRSQALERVLGALARTQGKLPTEESIRLLADAQRELAELEASLRPSEVREFLTAAARGGASVELLTEDVLQWIREHRALRNFRVIVGVPGGTSD